MYQNPVSKKEGREGEKKKGVKEKQKEKKINEVG
jgi:hypothetical protein